MATMRKLVVPMTVSLDGFFEGPDHDIGWHMVDEELHRYVNDDLRGMSAFLSGRTSWQLMAGYWPAIEQQPDAGETEADFSRIWRDMPKVVYSRTLTEAGWNTTIERDVDPDAIRRLKAQPGGDMALGGGNIATTFRRYGLIDEYRLYINPIAIGAGTPLFPPSETPITLRLLDSRTFGNGVVQARYAPE
jgi:dihydrofolate reductase